MVQETLAVSTKRINVQYRFLNESSTDIQATVAFPMPPYGWNAGQAAVDANEQPMTSFVARVDGSSVATKRHRRAEVDGRDVTATLRAAGLSEKQIFETFGVAPDGGDGLTKTQRRAVSGTEKFDTPNWKVAETMVWEQLFPAMRELAVEHEYAPFVGMVYDLPYQSGHGFVRGNNLVPSSADGSEKKTVEACTHEGAQRAVDRQVKLLAATNPKSVVVTLRDVEYVLGTGRNWLGPIAEFRLVIEKDTPDQIVSLCFPGKSQRTSATTLEFRHANFVPQDKLVVYFYTVEAR